MYLKHCCALCEALVEPNVRLLYSGTNKFAYALSVVLEDDSRSFFFFVSTLISCHNFMWQSRVEMKGYSVAYFNRTAAFEVPYC